MTLSKHFKQILDEYNLGLGFEEEELDDQLAYQIIITELEQMFALEEVMIELFEMIGEDTFKQTYTGQNINMLQWHKQWCASKKHMERLTEAYKELGVERPSNLEIIDGGKQ